MHLSPFAVICFLLHINVDAGTEAHCCTYSKCSRTDRRSQSLQQPDLISFVKGLLKNETCPLPFFFFLPKDV